MEQYISKSALAAEIERRIKGLKECHADTVPGYAGEISGLKRLLSFLDTLEVKEVDLEKEYKDFVEEDSVYNKLVNGIVGKAIAKHFFELGLKAQIGE